MAEKKKIAQEYEIAMKKGFIGLLVLLILEKTPSYGYKISKEINIRTLGLWDPPSSTMYTVLKDLTKKGLIEIFKKIDDIRTRKVYNITKKGKESLSLILEKQKCIEDSIDTFKMTMMDEKCKNIIFKHGPISILLERIDQKSNSEKLEFLNIQKSRIESNIRNLSENLSKIKEIIKKIEQNKE